MTEPRVFCIEVDVDDDAVDYRDPRSMSGAQMVYVRARSEERALVEARCYVAGSISSRFSVGRATSCAVPAIPPAPDLDIVELEDADQHDDEEVTP